MVSRLGSLAEMANILWRQDDGPGAERTEIQTVSDGFRIAGTTLMVVDDVPHEIRYMVLTDTAWQTRTVGAHVQGPANDRRLALHSNGEGSWSVGDDPVLDLYGATDVDLSWTPATNTLAIRRLGLSVGDVADLVVARVAFPEHEVRRVRQRYTRLAHDRYRLDSGDDSVDMLVNDDGVVLDYPGGWQAVAVAP